MTNEQLDALFEREVKNYKSSKKIQVKVREKSRTGLVTREWMEEVEITCKKCYESPWGNGIGRPASMPINMRKTTFNAFRDEY